MLTMVFIGGLMLSISRFQFSDASYVLMFVYILLHISMVLASVLHRIHRSA